MNARSNRPLILMAALISACATSPTTPQTASGIVPQCVGESCEPTASTEAEGTLTSNPLPSTTLDVSFESQGDTLQGELVLPEDAAGPLPGAVIVHDHGPMNRDGIAKTSFGVQLPVEVSTYRSLAESLAGHGFAVLIYDKRTCIEGAAAWCNYPKSFLEKHQGNLPGALQADLTAALLALKSRPEVDRNQIIAIGHGDGATLVGSLPSDAVQKRVLLAFSGYPQDEVIHYQSERAIETLETQIAEKKSGAERDEMQKLLTELKDNMKGQEKALQDVRAGQGGAEDALGIPRSAWLEMFRQHAAALASLADSSAPPTLVIAGEDDLDYPEDNAAVIENATQGSQKVLNLDGVGHLLVDLEGDATVTADEVHEAIIEFVTR